MTRLSDRTAHHDYNAWHQLDHLPENLALPGVLWGDRWVLAPDCRPLLRGSRAETPPDYAVMYWFRTPADEAVREWTELNRRALWWGRRPELAYTDRQPIGFLTPAKSYASPGALVAADVVPLRPHAGVHLTLSLLREPMGPSGVAAVARHDRESIPSLLEVPGVAGVSTYFFHSAGDAFGRNDSWGDRLFVRLIHLESDPVEATNRITAVVPDWDESTVDEEVVFAASLRSIAPYAWDWFGADV